MLKAVLAVIAQGNNKMVVKVVSAEEVRAINGKELGKDEINNFEVTMIQGTDTLIVTPFHAKLTIKCNTNFVLMLAMIMIITLIIA